ncbi:hypothetical protein NPIL_241861 [Nephila pilipes]|uniref:Uncharacterized protein n=1 Tax=Nephila pilipes TaxID=299642 RepID=A0A8X6TNA2_NEPPI|nr:hypothetical protein NPIL_241861 [Nephila pilipes]
MKRVANSTQCAEKALSNSINNKSSQPTTNKNFKDAQSTQKNVLKTGENSSIFFQIQTQCSIPKEYLLSYFSNVWYTCDNNNIPNLSTILDYVSVLESLSIDFVEQCQKVTDNLATGLNYIDTNLQ